MSKIVCIIWEPGFAGTELGVGLIIHVTGVR